MKKHFLLAVLVIICLLTLSACGCKHETWNEADCVNPKTCAECGEIEGAPLGHSWLAATCDTAKTCENCAETEGEPIGHSWTDATCETPKTCSVCNQTEGEALGHSWAEATCETPKTCSVCAATEGEALEHTWVDATTEAPKTCTGCGATEGEPLTLSDFENSAICLAVQGAINQNMADYSPAYKYDADANIFYIYLTAPEGTAFALVTSKDAFADAWDTITDSLSDLSLTCYQSFVTVGYDVNCAIMLLNDQNPDNVLLSVLNGDVIYDAGN